MTSFRPNPPRSLAIAVARVLFACVAWMECNVFSAVVGEPTEVNTASSEFDVEWDDGAIVSLRYAHDRFDTDYIRSRAALGDVVIRYRREGGPWQSASTAELAASGQFDAASKSGGNTYEAHYPLRDPSGETLDVIVRFAVEPTAMRWTIELKNESKVPIKIGDLALPLPMNSNFQSRRGATSAVLKHSFISGDGSFLFWMRPNSVGPYLTMTPLAGTHLEYWEAGSREGRRRDYRVFIHSTAAGEAAKSDARPWRQPHTSITLAPAGEADDTRVYGFKLRWADDYEAVRQILVDEGLVDVHVVPGMTVPSDLFAEIALRSKEPIAAVEAEFPDETKIEPLGRSGDYERYRVRFSRLGENRLQVHFGDNRHVYLEFFATEPLETLIKKRAAFIARSQHRDPSKWYNGLITDWNMDGQVLPSPDNYDRISGFRIYAVTCDDPGLCKPAYLAAKNAEYPVQQEVEALDYYIEHFVWGGLQRTTDESYPFGIYGIQDWRRNRTSDDPGRNGRLHLWRVYDYPHIVLMYYSMYRMAKNFPEIETRLSADEYLERAYGTANAMFTVPMAIEKWSAYWTGFYNELVLVDLIRELESVGKQTQADTLRRHWEKKVKVFVGGRADLFQSEYPFDSTGFESTHALAKYAFEHADGAGGRDLGISRSDGEKFMETQLAANIFCRGSIEPAYYYLGSDYRGSAGNSYTLSYMSQMGGWSVLDYALHYAPDPSSYLRLGYASILSSWALVNSGTPESNYGYWYPGKENDGGAGGGFEPAPFGQTWLGQPHYRGSWYYACEIDLGYSGALRAAATVLADDPIFGRFCFGGDWRTRGGELEVVPKDGVRRRFHALLDGRKLHLVLDTDRFVTDSPIRVKPDLTQVQFQLESDNLAEHSVPIHLSGLPAGRYVIRAGRRIVSQVELQATNRAQIILPFPAGGRSQTVSISAERSPGDKPLAVPPSANASTAAANYPTPVAADYVIRDFQFHSGETLPELRMHYLTLGEPVRDKAGIIRNAVMILHGTTGSSQQFLRPEFATELFGPGQPLDATRYFIVIPDNVGHGQSAKPSDGLRAKFPHYGYLDMIEAQHRLLTEGLGVDHARLIMGTSMGGMHTWLWGQLHPDSMDALLPLASLPDQIAGRNRVWRRIVIDAIRSDPAWNEGNYETQPAGLQTALKTLYFMSTNPVIRLQEGPTLREADEALDRYLAERSKDYDANDVAYAVDASHDYDPAPGLGKIKAPLLAINFADDLINPPELGVLEREIGRVPHGRAVVLPLSDQTVGHGTHTKATVWKELLVKFLRETEPAE